MNRHRDSAPSGPRSFRPLTASQLKFLGLDAPTQLPIARVRAASRSPFLFRKRLLDLDLHTAPGDLVCIRDARDAIVGYGLANPRSEMVVRILSDEQEPPGEEFWRRRLSEAWELRRDILHIPEQSNACRLIHAEGDGLSGLVIDQFDDVLSMEAFSVAMYLRGEAIARLAMDVVGAKHWILRPGPKMVGQEGLEAPILQSSGAPKQVEIREHGTRFRIRFQEAHKTGFFCDQRENRRRLAELSRGRNVLDLCCYTGGFAIQAKKLGMAEDVTAVELDEAPLALAKENANLNQVRINFVQADAFAYMRDMIRSNRKYGVVVLDPPKLITNRQEMEEGKRKHFDLNRLAMYLVEPGGLLLTCCCAGLLEAGEFEQLVLTAARQTPIEPEGRTGRRAQILARTSASPDHPVADNCPETDYLKALWLRVL